jgi:hypothetical protein
LRRKKSTAVAIPTASHSAIAASLGRSQPGLEDDVAISRRIVEVAEAILFAAAVLALLSAPVLFVVLFAPQAPAKGTYLIGLHEWPDPPPDLLPCICADETRADRSAAARVR